MADLDEPKITVRLETDALGHPTVIEGERRHYKVVLEVENAPADTYGATFELDPSYYDPVRTLSPDKDGKFRLETMAFGDYPIIVRLHREKGDDMLLREGVARALKRERRTLPDTPEVDDALSYIAEH
jgi:hypothetical protein